jgi:hypothetical protein
MSETALLASKGRFAERLPLIAYQRSCDGATRFRSSSARRASRANTTLAEARNADQDTDR